ncbi:hypothetical protein [Streptomyces sp. C36]|uniref:hypothetical protein n=1 Tax=Streptomyces sp. C36 TaxID=3237122 RepID=UPI0034C63341
MTEPADWAAVCDQARQESGYSGPEPARTVDAIGAALRLDHRADFYAELGTLVDGAAFDVFLDHWWTQALADNARDEAAREAAIDFADLAVSLRARAADGPTYTMAEVEAMLADAS